MFIKGSNTLQQHEMRHHINPWAQLDHKPKAMEGTKGIQGTSSTKAFGSQSTWPVMVFASRVQPEAQPSKGICYESVPKDFTTWRCFQTRLWFFGEDFRQKLPRPPSTRDAVQPASVDGVQPMDLNCLRPSWQYRTVLLRARGKVL